MTGQVVSMNVKQAFMAGVVSTSAIWALVSLCSRSKGSSTTSRNRKRLKKRKQSLASKEEHHQKDDTSFPRKDEKNDDDGDHSVDSMECKDRLDPMEDISYNPWRNQEVVQYKQLLELRKSFLEHSKRTSLLFLDAIISQAKLLEIPTKKRLRWPWETLRKHQDGSSSEHSMMNDSSHLSNDSNFESSSAYDHNYLKDHHKANPIDTPPFAGDD